MADMPEFKAARTFGDPTPDELPSARLAGNWSDDDGLYVEEIISPGTMPEPPVKAETLAVQVPRKIRRTALRPAKLVVNSNQQPLVRVPLFNEQPTRKLLRIVTDGPGVRFAGARGELDLVGYLPRNLTNNGSDFTLIGYTGDVWVDGQGTGGTDVTVTGYAVIDLESDNDESEKHDDRR